MGHIEINTFCNGNQVFEKLKTRIKINAWCQINLVELRNYWEPKP